MHNVDPESFLAKNRAGAVMSYRTRIYKKPLERVLLLRRLHPLAEILGKYTLESKATTPNSACCSRSAGPSRMRSPGAQLHGSIA